MKSKRLKLILSLIALAFVLTGCSTSTELITLDTTFSEAMNDGFLSAFITYPLSQAINWLTPRTGIFLAITIVTIVINAIVLAFTFKSSVAMQKMQEIQPELQKIQAKYEGRQDEMSQQRMAMEMQQVYNKYGINPLGSLAATFIQFPLLIGMYNAVRRSHPVPAFDRYVQCRQKIGCGCPCDLLRHQPVIVAVTVDPGKRVAQPGHLCSDDHLPVHFDQDSSMAGREAR